MIEKHTAKLKKQKYYFYKFFNKVSLDVFKRLGHIEKLLNLLVFPGMKGIFGVS